MAEPFEGYEAPECFSPEFAEWERLTGFGEDKSDYYRELFSGTGDYDDYDEPPGEDYRAAELPPDTERAYGVLSLMDFPCGGSHGYGPCWEHCPTTPPF